MGCHTIEPLLEWRTQESGYFQTTLAFTAGGYPWSLLTPCWLGIFTILYGKSRHAVLDYDVSASDAEDQK